MTPDTQETLQSALDDLTRRVAAFEQAQKNAADVEPPMLTDYWLRRHEEGDAPAASQQMAAARLRYVEAELARLREGLKWQDEDIDDEMLTRCYDNPHGYGVAYARRMIREIQRHRALATK